MRKPRFLILVLAFAVFLVFYIHHRTISVITEEKGPSLEKAGNGRLWNEGVIDSSFSEQELLRVEFKSLVNKIILPIQPTPTNNLLKSTAAAVFTKTLTKSSTLQSPTPQSSILAQTNNSTSTETVKKIFKRIVLLDEIPIFNPNIMAVGKALNDRNISYSVAKEFDPNDQEDAVYITCATHLLKKVPKYYISYNWEQLDTDKNWNPEFFKRFQNAVEVWDYSYVNIDALKKKANVTAKYFPMLYFDYSPPQHVITENITEIETKPYDVIFFGSRNQKRDELLGIIREKYKSKPEKLVYYPNQHGKELDILMKKCKIGLNIHFFGGKTILEVHRLSFMILNGVIILSERSADLDLDKKYENIVNFFTKETLLAEIDKIIAWTPQKYLDESLKRLEAYKKLGSFNENLDKSNSILLLTEPSRNSSTSE